MWLHVDVGASTEITALSLVAPVFKPTYKVFSTNHTAGPQSEEPGISFITSKRDVRLHKSWYDFQFLLLY